MVGELLQRGIFSPTTDSVWGRPYVRLFDCTHAVRALYLKKVKQREEFRYGQQRAC
jgi:hypothetical protein